MSDSFGGKWTQDKLECIEKYLNAYMTIMKKNRKAKYFNTIYIDAFAGSGKVEIENEPYLFDDEFDDFLVGSVERAVNLEKPFDEYIFIDNDKNKIEHLDQLKDRHPDKSIEIEVDDANKVLNRICSDKNWTDNRAVVFLDPYGMQVNWNTVECIAQTQAVDMWYWFPLGIGVLRLLKRNGEIKESHRNRLNEIFGDNEWEQMFYETFKKYNLFGENVEETRRIAGYKDIVKYIQDKLRLIFSGVASNPKIFYNSRNNPMYLLCFAAGNQKGAKIAVKIANDIMEKL